MKKKNITLSDIAWLISLSSGFWIGFHVLPSCDELSEVFLKVTIILFPLCLLLPLVAPSRPWLCPILAVGAIAVGIGVDALTDTAMDRNLWGLEVIFAQIIAAPSVVIGGVAGIFLSRKIRKNGKHNKSSEPT